MKTTTLTNEDYAILARNVRRGVRVGDHHDFIDYRVMLAHVGGYSRHLSPADKLRQEWRTCETTREWEEFRRSQVRS